MNEKTTPVAVLVAFSRNAMAKIMAAAMASIRASFRALRDRTPVRVRYLLGFGHEIFGLTPT
jgi:hypothetical protein